jgi:MFS-type transporter involved in bile tolerance (Atg22 family)
VTKLYTVLFSTFWLLFVSSFIGTKLENKEQAQKIYSDVMLVSVVLSLLTIPLVGKVVDMFNP